MKKDKILIFLILLINISFGNTIKFQTGISFSKFNWKMAGIKMFKETFISQPVSVGMDYFNSNYINLESNIGYCIYGGKETYKETNEIGEKIGTAKNTAKLKYVSINTLINMKYPLDNKFTPFISMGPFFEYLTDKNKYFNNFYKKKLINKESFGLLLGGGIKYNYSKYQIGIRTDYYLNLNYIMNDKYCEYCEKIKIRKYSTTLNFFFGYKF